MPPATDVRHPTRAAAGPTALAAGRLHPRPVAAAITVRLFLTCWVLFTLHFATNAVREVYLALSIGDHLSFDVSDYAGLHPDLFELPGRGTFINNNPGASLVGAVPYAAARPLVDVVVDRVLARRKASGATPPPYDSPWPMAREFHRRTFERGLDVKLGLGAAVTQALAMAPISALGVVTMFHLLRARTNSEKAALWLAILYAFATPVLYRTAQLNHNLLVAHCAFFAFALLWRPWDGAGGSPKRPWYFLAGLLTGWAVVCDYSGVVVALAISVYGLLRRRSLPREAKRPSDPARYVGGMLTAAAALMGYQWACFGNPILPAQFYMPEPGHGYRGMMLPDPELFLRTAFDPRFGLFVSAPLLLLAFHAQAWLAKPTRLLPRLELGFCLTFIALFSLFCSMAGYGYLQFNTGVRFVMPIVPFLFILTGSVLLRMPRPAAITIGVLGTYWSWCLAMYREVELGRGVVESVVHVTTEGIRFPWMITAQRMGYVPAGAMPGVMLAIAAAAAICAIWLVRRPRPDPMVAASTLQVAAECTNS